MHVERISILRTLWCLGKGKGSVIHVGKAGRKVGEAGKSNDKA